ncbi:MAG: glycosyltransferase family 2 protein [Planctomycetota bacterium]
MPRLSIIIPVLGDCAPLEDTLVSVLANRPESCEVIVALRQPYADPYNIKDEVIFALASPRASLAGVINAGIALARAPILHTLACGLEVTPGWTEEALAAFAEDAVGAVAPLVLEPEPSQRIAFAGFRYTAGGAWKAVGRSRRIDRGLCGSAHAAPDASAAFYRTAALEAVGGFDESLGAMCGADAALKLRQVGFRSALAAESKVRRAVALPLDSEMARGCTAETLFWRWAPLDGWRRALLAHAAMLVGEAVLCPFRPSITLRLMGRFAAMLGAFRQKRHWESLAESMQPLAANFECPTCGESEAPIEVQHARRRAS